MGDSLSPTRSKTEGETTLWRLTCHGCKPFLTLPQFIPMGGS